MTGDSIDKAGKKLTPVFGAGGCVIGGTMTIALSDGSLVMFSPQACVEGAVIGTTIGIGKSEVGKIIKYAGQAGKELSKDSESSNNSSNTSSEKKPEYKTPKQGTGKEKASDVPSWAKGNRPYKGESGNDFAKRLMDNRYGKGNYKTGSDTEYNRIKKWGDRGFQ